MTRTIDIKLAASTALLTLVLTGCSTGLFGSGPARSASQSNAAEKALARGDVDKALSAAEEAVARDPANPAHRALLGQAYLAAGRFASAERSFADVIDLDAADARSVIGVALARTGQGKPEMAIATLNAHRAILPASDYGLAMALAGDTATAIDVLSRAIRESDSSPRTRQNLALAYALAGQWRDAQLMAGRDAGPQQVLASLADWAKIARPGAYEARVASVLKVTPATMDPGQPVRLALRPAEPQTVDVADAPQIPAYDAPLAAVGPAVADEPAMAFAPVAETPAAERQVQIMPVAVPASTAAAPVPPQPVIDTPVRMASIAGPAPVLAKQPTRPVARRAAAGGTMAVQLGAFSSEAAAKAAWNRLSRSVGALGSAASRTTKAVVKGKTFYRLAAVNLSKPSARTLCASVKAKGSDCFVRPMATDVRMAGTAPKRIASR